MAAADTARLIASLELQDKFSKTAGNVEGSLGRLDRKFGGLGRAAKIGGAAIAAGGAIAAAGIAAAVKGGLADLSELENATTAVDGAIAQVGMTGQVTAGQIATWANEIEGSVQAAFDDKDITASTATLLRYGKVATENIRPAMEVMTDLAARTGSVESASTLLGKALADPAKAAGKLARAGVILTKSQQDQIKAMVKVGDTAGAQKLLLDALADTTRNAARDSVGPYGDALSMLADAQEDARKALAVGFLPVITRVSEKLTELVSNPRFLAGVETFGRNLASAFDAAIDFAEQVDWKSIGDGLRVAFDWAGKLFGAFMSMPAEVKGTIIALAGLNKLSGGAVSGIIGELGKGLIKGVLGMTAGVVNLRAATVTGMGAGAAGGVAGKAGGIASAVMKVALVGMAAAVAVQLGQELAAQSERIREQGKGLTESAKTNAPKMNEKEIVAAIRQIDEQMADPLKTFALAVTNPLNGGLDNLEATQQTLKDQLATLTTETGASDERIGARIDSMNTAVASATTTAGADTVGELNATKRAVADQVRSSGSTTASAVDRTTYAARNAGMQTATAMANAASRIVAAVNALDLSVNVTAVNRTTTVNNRYGPTGGSASTSRWAQ